MASRSCVSFCSSLHVAFDSVFRCLFLQYREIEFAAIVGHNLPARFEPELFQENGLLLQVFLLLGNQIMEPSFELSELFSCDLFRLSSKNHDLPRAFCLSFDLYVFVLKHWYWSSWHQGSGHYGRMHGLRIDTCLLGG